MTIDTVERRPSARLEVRALLALAAALAMVPISASAEMLHSEFDGQIQLHTAFTKYGRGSVQCPNGFVALGGGSTCTLGDLDMSFPMTDGTRPVGWSEWHRGKSSNDCAVYAVCAPEEWFAEGQIKVQTRTTGYGQGQVSCSDGAEMRFRAISGGSRCTNGDFDVSYPTSTGRPGRSWSEWHRGGSSNDCRVSAVCVDEEHWVVKNSTIVSDRTGYGQGEVSCNGDVAIGGGSYCTLGDFDVASPIDDMSGWSEWHRGKSSNDCRVYATCLDVTRRSPGMTCGSGSMYDCNLKCVNTARARSWTGDGYCDDGRWGMDLMCGAFDNDAGDCD